MSAIRKGFWKCFVAAMVLLIGINLVGCGGPQDYKAVPPTEPEFTPKITVPVDMEVVKANQKSVDEGHSPWQLDPLQTTMTFVSTQMNPQGVTGEFPIKMEDLKAIKQTSSDAIVEVSGDKTPTGKVYLKRLIRKDNTGIWTVVGYDPKEQQGSIKLSPFNGDAEVIEADKVLKLSDEKWKHAKDGFLKEHNPYPGDEIQGLRQTDFKSERSWQGTLNNKRFELELYSNVPYQVLIVKYGDAERISLMMDFYNQPWIFFGEGVRMQLITKGVGVTYNIVTGEFADKSEQEIEVFDSLAFELRNQRIGGGAPVGSEIEIAGNKIRFADKTTIVIK